MPHGHWYIYTNILLRHDVIDLQNGLTLCLTPHGCDLTVTSCPVSPASERVRAPRSFPACLPGAVRGPRNGRWGAHATCGPARSCAARSRTGPRPCPRIYLVTVAHGVGLDLTSLQQYSLLYRYRNTGFKRKIKYFLLDTC